MSTLIYLKMLNNQIRLVPPKEDSIVNQRFQNQRVQNLAILNWIYYFSFNATQFHSDPPL